MVRMILPAERDPRLITSRRGGTLSDTDHYLLALWAAGCAEHVLHYFDQVRPEDSRPREAIDAARAWVCGEMRMSDARKAAFASNAAAREVSGAARFAALAGGKPRLSPMWRLTTWGRRPTRSERPAQPHG
jgi:hypothetical protein